MTAQAISPPGKLPHSVAVEYLRLDDLSALTAEAGLRTRNGPQDHVRCLPQLNYALNQYAFLAQANAPSAREVQDWRSALIQNIADTHVGIGNCDKDIWIELETQVQVSDIKLLRLLLAKVSERLSISRPDSGKRNLARWALFRKIAPLFEETYRANYAVTVRENLPSSGRALLWSRRLFETAAATPGAAAALQQLGQWAQAKPEGMALLIKQARAELQERRELLGQAYIHLDSVED